MKHSIKKKRFSIIYSSYARIPSKKANSIHVMKMCGALAGASHRVELMVPRFFGSRVVEDVFDFYGVRRSFYLRKTVPLSLLTALIHALMVAVRAKNGSCDIVYTREASIAFFTTAFRVPTCLEMHDTLYQKKIQGKKCSHIRIPIKKIEEAFFKRTLQQKFLLGVVFISKALRAHFCKAYRIPDHKTLVVHDGADVVSDSIRCKEENSRVSVGYAGHLYPGRGIELIIALAEQFPEINFNIAGGHQSAVQILRKRYAYHNLIFHGFLPPHTIASFLCSNDILIAPYQKIVSTKYNGAGNTASWMSPLKIFEYMAAAKPIITSKLPSLSEVLTNHKNALLCDPDCFDEWVEALKILANDKLLRHQLGSHALKNFLNNYTWDTRAQKILTFLRITMKTPEKDTHR